MPTKEEDELDKKLRGKINDGNYTLFDKIMYGGLGYGYFCLPANLFKIIIAVLFPPFGIIIHNLGKVTTKFPYVGSKNLTSIFMKIDEFLISLILTGLFYVPGLIYTFGKMKLNSADSNTTKDKFKDTHKDNKDNKDNKSNKSNKSKTQSKGSSYNIHNTRNNLDDIKKRLGID
jgi:uncharacterized membrane protein YqaE (UPF0057 family)